MFCVDAWSVWISDFQDFRRARLKTAVGVLGLQMVLVNRVMRDGANRIGVVCIILADWSRVCAVIGLGGVWGRKKGVFGLLWI